MIQGEPPSGLVAAILDWVGRASLGDWGSLASIISLLLTAFVLLNVREIRTFYVARARLPKLAKRLREHSKKVSECLNDFTRFRTPLVQELAQAEATVQSIHRNLPRSGRASAKPLMVSLRAFDKRNPQEGQAQDCYLGMLRLQEHLKHVAADLDWER